MREKTKKGKSDEKENRILEHYLIKESNFDLKEVGG